MLCKQYPVWEVLRSKNFFTYFRSRVVEPMDGGTCGYKGGRLYSLYLIFTTLKKCKNHP